MPRSHPSSAVAAPARASERGAVPRRALVLLAILTLVWGTNWPLFPIAVREVSVWTFRAVSLTISGGALLLVAHLRGQSLSIPRVLWPTLVLASVCYLVVWNLATAYSAATIPSGQSAVLGFTMPLWAALLGWLVLHERPTGRMLLAIGLGALSVIALIVPNLSTYADAPAGLAAGLAAGFGWAVGTLILKRRKIEISALVLSGWQTLIATVPITIGALVLGDHQWFMPSWPSIAVILYIALVPLTIGNACWFAIVRLLPTNLAGLSSILVPVVAMLSGAAVHDEPLGPLQWFAMAAIVAALSLALLQRPPHAPTGHSSTGGHSSE